MTFKSIEFYYDIDRIPGISGDVAGPGLPARDVADIALAFRNAAIELIEDALLDAQAGEWEEADIGKGEISFGFAVDDFDAAEAIVRKTVAGTPFAQFRKIVRREFDTVAFACLLVDAGNRIPLDGAGKGGQNARHDRATPSQGRPLAQLLRPSQG